MSRRTLSYLIAPIVIVALLSGCAGPNPLVHTPGRHGVAGFWSGLWHGMICLVTFIISLFNRHVHVYEVHNNGAWYDLGFLLGAGLVFGGGGNRSQRRR